MKKKLIRTTSLLLVACLLFLFGCQNPGDAPAKTPEEFWARPHEWQSEHLMEGNSNENGYYYMKENSFLMYLDYTTKQSVTLCNKVGCKHDDYTCESFIEGFSPYIFFYEEKLCLITDDEEGLHIFKCDLDATNRESKIILMQDEMEKGNAVSVGDVLINGDDLYYVATYQEPGDASAEKKNPIKSIRHVDMKTWKDEEICRSVENRYNIVGADADGALILERPDPFVVTKVDYDSLSKEELKQGVKTLTMEKCKELPVEVFYWDKKMSNSLTVYQSNYQATYYVPFAEGSCLYMLTRLDGVALEKMDMRTRESEWLWKEKERTGEIIINALELNHRYYLSLLKRAEDISWQEVYTKGDFQRVSPPFLKASDSVLFEDEHGYIVYKMIEKQTDDSELSDVVDIAFVPREEEDKENPEYTVLYSYGRDE